MVIQPEHCTSESDSNANNLKAAKGKTETDDANAVKNGFDCDSEPRREVDTPDPIESVEHNGLLCCISLSLCIVFVHVLLRPCRPCVCVRLA